MTNCKIAEELNSDSLSDRIRKNIYNETVRQFISILGVSTSDIKVQVELIRAKDA
ncbi:hypothetical protein GWK48_11150 [Metallosphaera tengchongensis]|uniref:Uncharacterized protein n=1 Tax=Metallosphaera tengchongensis TaxID=1532350 RepID=A0A6N0NVL0_9CREN|nr:hypothetical protein [Metallosphaera tengchongensis]QKR00866.1 hypothetical protein GWK48_11150 [Metallosphaera tengchongensis]